MSNWPGPTIDIRAECGDSIHILMYITLPKHSSLKECAKNIENNCDYGIVIQDERHGDPVTHQRSIEDFLNWVLTGEEICLKQNTNGK